MAFGGTVNRGMRIDTRRFRRVNSLGSNPDEQAKLLGGHHFQSFYDDYGQSRRTFCEEITHKEMKNPDMTPVPRRTDRTVKLYVRGRMVIGFEILGADEGLFED